MSVMVIRDVWGREYHEDNPKDWDFEITRGGKTYLRGTEEQARKLASELGPDATVERKCRARHVGRCD